MECKFCHARAGKPVVSFRFCPRCGFDQQKSLHPCDDCSKEVLPWKIHFMPSRSSISFLGFDDILAHIQQVLTSAKSSHQVVAMAPAISNLCDKCWRRTQSNTYHEIPARTTDKGIYLNNLNRAYYQANYPNSLELDIIRSFTFHEVVHWVSHDHKGFQGRRDKIDWDECITDYIARKAYLSSYSTYKTNYGDGSEVFTKMKQSVAKAAGSWTIKNLSEEDKGKLQDQEKAIEGDVLTWYFKNPQMLHKFLDDEVKKSYFLNGLNTRYDLTTYKN